MSASSPSGTGGSSLRGAVDVDLASLTRTLPPGLRWLAIRNRTCWLGRTGTKPRACDPFDRLLVAQSRSEPLSCLKRPIASSRPTTDGDGFLNPDDPFWASDRRTKTLEILLRVPRNCHQRNHHSELKR